MPRRTSYGRGHPDFLAYVDFIAKHPAYQGMPDAILESGGVQWEAPSNRSSGQFKHTHQKRLDWWRRRAIEVGIDPETVRAWISRTAKAIHPTKTKPCKNCGRKLDIRYLYPSKTLRNRILRLPYVESTFPLDPLERVTALVTRLVERFGDRTLRDFLRLFRARGIEPPPNLTLDGWRAWLENEYAPREPKTLSPGVMSNAPDRFDGFHSFNICCRSKTDRGRAHENLQSYVTDRRVFEYWVDGDWVTANHLMGRIRSDPGLKGLPCRFGHPGPCGADHIGPISLGFSHRPEFRLLCGACNSAKNNRLGRADVDLLIEAHKRGEHVASWYCTALWQRVYPRVDSEESALRLSKLLRDNRHTAMKILHYLYLERHVSFLAGFLNLDSADREPMLGRIGVRDSIVRPEALTFEARDSKYALEQKARRIRVAFMSLKEYAAKPERNAWIVESPGIDFALQGALRALTAKGPRLARLDDRLCAALDSPSSPDVQFCEVLPEVPLLREAPEPYVEARSYLGRAMDQVAAILADEWQSTRYRRATNKER